MTEMNTPEVRAVALAGEELQLAQYSAITLHIMPGHPKQHRYDRNVPPSIKIAESGDASLNVDNKGILSNSQVMALIWGAFGGSNQDMAHDLYVTRATACTHRAVMYRRIGAKSMAHAVSLAFQSGVLSRRGEQIKQLDITRRQFDVLEGVSQGLTRPEVAQRLGITEATARTHSGAVMYRNNVTSIAHAVTRAYLSGQLLVPPPETEFQSTLW